MTGHRRDPPRSTPHRSAFSLGDDGPPSDWNENELNWGPDDVWDAFELDDTILDPQPEYGDFWPEAADDGMETIQ